MMRKKQTKQEQCAKRMQSSSEKVNYGEHEQYECVDIVTKCSYIFTN